MEPEDRKYFRLPVQTPLVFKIIRGKNPEEKSPPFSGTLKDISLGGIQFGTNTLNYGELYVFNEFERTRDRDFKPNLLLVKFSLPGEGEPFIIYCHPRWSGQGDLVDTFDFYIGARYAKIKKEDILRLQAYIQGHGDENALQRFYHQKKEDDRKRKTEEILIQKYVRATLPIRYQIISTDGEKKSRPVNAVTYNLSAFGLCAQVEDIDVDGLHMVFNDSPMKRNTLQIEISIPAQQTFTIIGEVRWFERISGKSKYNYTVGIKFLKVSEKDIKTIVEFIKDKPDDESKVVRRW